MAHRPGAVNNRRFTLGFEPTRTSILGLVVLFAALSVAGCDNGSARSSATSGATSVVSTDPSVRSPQQELIDEWASRLEGKTVSYLIDLECFCAAAGKWSVVESNGSVTEAEFLGDGEPGGKVPKISLSAGLAWATTANGPVKISGTETTLRLSVDVDVDSIDDEFGFSISDFTVLDE